MTGTADPQGELIAIGEVAATTGIAPETLRMWERRYGRPVAVRLPSGHRRYTAEQVRWLRRVAEALAHGHRPGRVVPLDDADLEQLLGSVTADGVADEEVERLLGWAQDMRGLEICAALEARWDKQRPVAFMSGTLASFLRAVGRAWTEGRLEIRHEHFVTELVQELLQRLRAQYPRARPGRAVLLATLPDERHGLGLHMAALLCAARGVPYHLLGVDTPLEEIAAATAELRDVAMVAISVSLSTGGVETDRRLAALRDLLPGDVRLVVGGEGARGVRRGPRGVEYTDDLEAWNQALEALAAAA